MKTRLTATQQYYIDIFNRIVILAPAIAVCAALVFTMGWIGGFFRSTPKGLLILFDVISAGYIISSVFFRKKGILVDERLDMKTLRFGQSLLTVLIIAQWNLITYIFPSREFWGYACLFIILSAFFFDTKSVSVTGLGIIASTVLSWSINPELLPVQDENYTENLILRCVALTLSYAAVYFFVRYAEQFKREVDEMTLELRENSTHFKKLSYDVVTFAGDIIGQRDSLTGEHVSRVKEITCTLLRCLGKQHPEYNLTPAAMRYITAASALHDVGKIRIPDRILLKPGKLTTEEFETMKAHTRYGAEIIDMLPEDTDPVFRKYCHDICLFHHEKVDGKGYPYGLKGEDIPLAAQIVGLADAFDALTTARPYKDAYSSEKAAEIILNGECGAFSEEILACFKLCIEAKEF